MSDQEYKYEGEYNDKNQRHGQGRAEFFNGDKYEGQYEFGKRHGYGVYRFANGAVYDGDWNMGKKHGKGMFTYPDGSKYDGEWADDRRSGQGEYFYTNGDHYVGEWRNHVRHGHGKYTYVTSGLQYIGEWRDGKRSGDGEVTRVSQTALASVRQDFIMTEVGLVYPSMGWGTFLGPTYGGGGPAEESQGFIETDVGVVYPSLGWGTMLGPQPVDAVFDDSMTAPSFHSEAKIHSAHSQIAPAGSHTDAAHTVLQSPEPATNSPEPQEHVQKDDPSVSNAVHSGDT